MNFILISPHFPKNFIPFARELKEKGITVLGIGDEIYAHLEDELKNSLTEYYKVSDLENTDEVKKAVAYLFYKHGPIDRIESHNEYWLELDAELREQFNVPGVRPKELKKMKYKSEMKKVFKEAGVPVVEGLVINQPDEIDGAIQKLGLPIIAKPDNGVGSAATFKLQNEQDVLRFKEYYTGNVPYFFEQMIQSDRLGTYDGLIDQNGQIVFETTLLYSKPTLDFIEGKADMAYIIQKDLDPKLVEYGHSIVKAFGMKERFFHIEFFKMDDGDYIALEYNNRIAGNYSIDLYNYAHSINLFSEYASVVLGDPFKGNPKTENKYCVGITQRDMYKYKHNSSQIKAHFIDNLKRAERMPEAFSELMGNDFYAITADSQEEVDAIISYIHEREK